MDQCLLVAQLCILPVHPSTAPLPSLTLPTSTLPPLRSSSAADQCLLVAQLCILCTPQLRPSPLLLSLPPPFPPSGAPQLRTNVCWWLSSASCATTSRREAQWCCGSA